MHDGRNIACVDAAGRLTIEKRPAEIEIPMLDKWSVPLAGGANGGGGQGVAAAVLAGIGGTVTGSEDHRARRAAIRESIWKAEERK